jgi:hypothetical protein
MDTPARPENVAVKMATGKSEKPAAEMGTDSFL